MAEESLSQIMKLSLKAVVAKQKRKSKEWIPKPPPEILKMGQSPPKNQFMPDMSMIVEKQAEEFFTKFFEEYPKKLE